MSLESSTERVVSSNRRAAEFRSKKSPAVRGRKFFRVVAKYAYPKKTVPNVRELTGYSDRAIYDWLAGHVDAPTSVFMALLGEITRDRP